MKGIEKYFEDRSCTGSADLQPKHVVWIEHSANYMADICFSETYIGSNRQPTDNEGVEEKKRIITKLWQGGPNQRKHSS